MKKKHVFLLGISALMGYALGIICFIRLLFKSNASLNKKCGRLDEYYNLLKQWLDLRQSGITLDKYFIDNNYNCIAIYGMGELGERLYGELKESMVTIRCAIDKNIGNTYTKLHVCNPENCPRDVDVIVVTPTFAFREIANELSGYVNCPIISLEDVVFGL